MTDIIPEELLLWQADTAGMTEAEITQWVDGAYRPAVLFEADVRPDLRGDPVEATE